MPCSLSQIPQSQILATPLASKRDSVEDDDYGARTPFYSDDIFPISTVDEVYDSKYYSYTEEALLAWA